MKILIVDTETGGFDPQKHAILSVAMVVWEDGMMDDSLHIDIADLEGELDLGALRVNGFTKERIAKGLTYEEAVKKITAFVKKHKKGLSEELCGHNVQFDVGFLKRLYAKAGVKYPFTHRVLCTQTLGVFFKLAGYLPEKTSVSLDSLCKYHEIQIRPPGSAHDALQDVTATGKLLDRYVMTVDLP